MQKRGLTLQGIQLQDILLFITSMTIFTTESPLRPPVIGKEEDFCVRNITISCSAQRELFYSFFEIICVIICLNIVVHIFDFRLKKFTQLLFPNDVSGIEHTGRQNNLFSYTCFEVIYSGLRCMRNPLHACPFSLVSFYFISESRLKLR